MQTTILKKKDIDRIRLPVVGVAVQKVIEWRIKLKPHKHTRRHKQTFIYPLFGSVIFPYPLQFNGYLSPSF